MFTLSNHFLRQEKIFCLVLSLWHANFLHRLAAFQLVFSVGQALTSDLSRQIGLGGKRHHVTHSEHSHPRPLPRAARDELGHRPHQRVEPIRRSGPMKARSAPKSHISSSSACIGGSTCLDLALLRTSRQPARRAATCRASRARSCNGIAGSTCAQHRPHHIAALVHLGDQRVGLEPAIQRDRLRRPSRRAQGPATVASSST